jgi:hypothetical protein
VEATGYILRIATAQWVDQVFDMAVYYTSIRRKWAPQQTILFIHRTSAGDAIVGYGVTENVYERDELPEEEKAQCEKYGWKKAIMFKYVMKFEKPLLVKETFLKERKYRGRCCQGLPLNKERLDSIMSQAELLQQ